MLELIFEKQQKLINEYVKIERNLKGDNVVVLNPSDLSSYEYQDKLRRIAWYVFEESQEAINARWDEENSKHPKVVEEWVDCLHFMTELCIFSGVTPSDITMGSDTKNIKVSNALLLARELSDGVRPMEVRLKAEATFLAHLGKAMNYLKNKPWKQTPKDTDVDKLRTELSSAYRALILVFFTVGVTSLEDMYQEYMKKHNINKERQSTGY